MGEQGRDLGSDTPGQRVYDAAKLLSEWCVQGIFDRFREDVPDIFGENLEFGFVFGGAAKGYAVANQDIDFFICLRCWDERAVERFRRWYFELHAELGLVPDRRDPGEAMTLARLEEKLEFVRAQPLRRVIETYYEYEAIVWADVLTSAKAAVIGDAAMLERICRRCECLPQRWRRELLGFAGDGVDREITKLPVTRLFRRYVKYLKVNRVPER
jgi:predicted nucleotidyltransferase